jgi:hypothetical protein
VGALADEDRYVADNCCWASPALSFSGLIPTGLLTNLEDQVSVFISQVQRCSVKTLILLNIFNYVYSSITALTIINTSTCIKFVLEVR